jgi:RimK family alpha-L-glutamate ligase
MEMTGWIIYSIADVEKNKNYIQMYIDKFKTYEIELETVILEEIRDLSMFIKNNTPDFAINRSRNGKVSEKLEKEGVRVFNNSSVTLIANNKGKTYEFLQGTVPFLPVQYKNNIITSQIGSTEFSYPYVIKSCGGHGGSQVFMVSNKREKEEILKTMGNQEYVVQQCCSDLGKDVRVYVIGNEIMAAVLRTSTSSFKSNYSLGGTVEIYHLNEREKNLVRAITDKLNLDYAGIDFTFHNGQAVFNEIEDAVGARMLYQVSDMDIVQMFVEYIIKEIKGKTD